MKTKPTKKVLSALKMLKKHITKSAQAQAQAQRLWLIKCL